LLAGDPELALASVIATEDLKAVAAAQGLRITARMSNMQQVGVKGGVCGNEDTSLLHETSIWTAAVTTLTHLSCVVIGLVS
jgi:hypothetical protein